MIDRERVSVAGVCGRVCVCVCVCVCTIVVRGQACMDLISEEGCSGREPLVWLLPVYLRALFGDPSRGGWEPILAFICLVLSRLCPGCVECERERTVANHEHSRIEKEIIGGVKKCEHRHQGHLHTRFVNGSGHGHT